MLEGQASNKLKFWPDSKSNIQHKIPKKNNKKVLNKVQEKNG